MVYVVPVKSVLGRLPIVLAGDTGTIPFKYRAGLPTEVIAVTTTSKSPGLTWHLGLLMSVP